MQSHHLEFVCQRYVTTMLSATLACGHGGDCYEVEEIHKFLFIHLNKTFHPRASSSRG